MSKSWRELVNFIKYSKLTLFEKSRALQIINHIFSKVAYFREPVTSLKFSIPRLSEINIAFSKNKMTEIFSM